MERRTKEIGIRKAIGASVASITGLLVREFMILIAVSNVIAMPVAFLITENILKYGFVYKRATIDMGIFLNESNNNKFDENRFYNGTSLPQLILIKNSHGNNFVHFSVTSNLVGGFAVKCDNNTIENATIDCNGTGTGINISGTNTNTTIRNITISNCEYGIVLQGNVSNSTIRDNIIHNNSVYGLYMEDVLGIFPFENHIKLC